jgi:hypothetical protein
MSQPKPLSEQVADVVRHCDALDTLCGEMLATLRCNMQTGRMTTSDDEQFNVMINAWSRRRLDVMRPV